MKKLSALIILLGAAFWYASSSAAMVYLPGEGWVYEEKETKATTTNAPGNLDQPGKPVDRRPTVAVLSFENLSGDSAAAHWRFTLTALINEQLVEAK